jgi:hypothetical protein
MVGLKIHEVAGSPAGGKVELPMIFDPRKRGLYWPMATR